jgi:phage FluMu protein Com
MTTKFKCTHCLTLLKASSAMAKRVVGCPSCKKQLRIPSVPERGADDAQDAHATADASREH